MPSKKAELRIGRALRELHREDVTRIDSVFSEAIAAVREHGTAAEINLKIKIKPTGKGESEVTADCTAVLPRRKPRIVTFFLTEENDLTREDPAQPELAIAETEGQDAAPSNISPMPVQPKAAVK